MAGIFSKIISGEIPSYKIFENEHVYSFLDICPVKPGHTLVVPKIEIDYFVDVPEPYYSEVFKAAKKISVALQKATGCVRVGTTILGFAVPHFHYHLIPLNEERIDFRDAKSLSKNDMISIQQKILSFM